MKSRVTTVLLAIVIFFSLTGLWASFNLTVDKIHILKDANAVLPCSVNSVINCASVMNTKQAEVLGFPNSIIGLICYSGLLFFIFGCILNKRISRSIILLSLAGAFGAIIFSYWLLFQSVYVIKILCPYCLISCFSATNIFFALLLLSFYENSFNFKEKLAGTLEKIVSKGYYIPVIVLWYVFVGILIFAQFKESLFGR